MRKIQQCIIAATLSAISVSAENYPYRDDFLWITVPDHSSWIYQTGEDATVSLQLLRYGQPASGAVIRYSLADDMLNDENTDSISLDTNGCATITMGTMQKPGFRDLRLSAKFDNRTSKHHVKVGFEPEKLSPYVGEPLISWNSGKVRIRR